MATSKSRALLKRKGDKFNKSFYPKYTSISNDKKHEVTEHIKMDKAHRKAYDKSMVSY
jgi:hypothetical protein